MRGAVSYMRIEEISPECEDMNLSACALWASAGFQPLLVRRGAESAGTQGCRHRSYGTSIRTFTVSIALSPSHRNFTLR